MKFKTGKMNMVEIGELNISDTFIDTINFDSETVFMVISTSGYDCNIKFDDERTTIAAVNLTSGEVWAYRTDEEVIPVETEEIIFNRK